MKFAKWFAGFFEDQAGTASSKRSVLYIAMFFLYLLLKGSLEGKTIDQQILYCVVGIILFCVGAVTSEFFNNKNITNISNTSNS